MFRIFAATFLLFVAPAAASKEPASVDDAQSSKPLGQSDYDIEVKFIGSTPIIDIRNVGPDIPAPYALQFIVGTTRNLELLDFGVLDYANSPLNQYVAQNWGWVCSPVGGPVSKPTKLRCAKGPFGSQGQVWSAGTTAEHSFAFEFSGKGQACITVRLLMQSSPNGPMLGVNEFNKKNNKHCRKF